MGFGSDIARGAAAQLFWVLVAVFLIGGAVTLGLYFGVSWLYENVTITVS
jgi:hypothetical protein